MDTNKKTARLAGYLYLVVVIAGVFGLAYVPGQIIAWKNAAATFRNVSDHELLFKLGMLGEALCYLAFIFLPLVLYKLFKPVHKNYALMMVILAVVSAPISFANLTNELNVLSILHDNDLIHAFSPQQVQAQVLASFNAYGNGLQVTSIFWGLWLFPFGYLVYRSGFLPKILGVFLMMGSVVDIIDILGKFFISGYGDMLVSDIITIPAAIGEFGICLWLVIAGAKETPVVNASTIQAV